MTPRPTRWKELRATVHRQLLLAGSMPCPRCHQPVTPDQQWDLDHLRPLALGGLDVASNLAPAHRRCNRAAGIRSALPPSRDW